MAAPTRVAYFGRWGAPGHYLRSPSGATLWDGVGPFRWDELDGAFCVNARRLGARRSPVPEADQEQSACKLTHRRGWTVLAFWDRTGDARGNSNSAFIAEGALGFEEMLAAAREHFPELLARAEAAAPLVLREGP